MHTSRGRWILFLILLGSIVAFLAACQQPIADVTLTVDVYTGSNYQISNTTVTVHSQAQQTVKTCDQITMSPTNYLTADYTVTWTNGLGTQSEDFKISPSPGDTRLVFSNAVAYTDSGTVSGCS